MMQTPEERVVERLIEKEYHIAFAESCTGGLCCAQLVNVPNASRVLDMSVVTYANEAKMKWLGVAEDTIAAHGVVSEAVAAEMAQGIAQCASCEVGVGITGIAGPGGATPQKPVGTVCFGFMVDGICRTFTKQFGAIGRQAVRCASVCFVFEILEELLK